MVMKSKRRTPWRDAPFWRWCGLLGGGGLFDGGLGCGGRFGGGGLRDTTRVSSGNPEMWAEILTENREALLGPLRETIADLGVILDHLENNRQGAAREWLATAKRRRDLLHPPS